MAGARVQCFLCSASIVYSQDDQARLLDHLRSEHSAESGEFYLIAGCLMNPEEREAIVNVVKNREPAGYDESPQNVTDDSLVDDIAEENAEDGLELSDVVSLSSLVPETTLQEGPEIGLQFGEASPPRSEVGLQFGEASPPRSNERPVVEFPCPECSLSFKLKIKLNRHLKRNHSEKVKSKEVKSEPTLPQPKVKTEKETPRKQGPRVWVPKHETDGVACPDCGKRFRSNGPMQRHFEDIHQPGEYPCRGCSKMFSSRNKMSSHYSRHCNPNRRKLSV